MGIEATSGDQATAEAPPRAELPSTDAGPQFALLVELMREINRGATMERVFALVADALRQIFSIDRFAIVLVQDDGTLALTSSRGLSEAYIAAVREHIEEGAGARAMARREPMWIHDAATSPDFWPLQDAARTEGFRTVLIVPLFSGPDPLGYIIMYHNEARTYTPAEALLAQALAQQAAFAVQNARLLAAAEQHRVELERRFQQRTAEAEAIDHIVLRISASLDLESTLTSIADAAATLSGAQTSSIYLRDADGCYRARAAHGVPLERLQRIVLTPSDGLLAEMCRTKQSVETVDYSHEVRGTREALREVARVGARAALGVPFIRNGEVVGALYVASNETDHIPPETTRILKRLASFAQVAVQNAQRFSSVEAERSRLQAYVDAIPEGVIVFDREGRVLLVNDSLQREWRVQAPLAGLSREEVFASPQRHSARPINFRFDPNAVFSRVLATGKPEQGLMELKDPSRTFEMHFSALGADRDGVRGVVATTRDITLPLELGRERSRSHLLAQLLDLSVVLNSDQSITMLMERVVEAAMALVGARAGTLGLLEGDKLVFRRFRQPDGWIDFDMQLSRGEGGPGYVWEWMMPYVSNACEADAHVHQGARKLLGFHRLVIVPVISREGLLVGTLGVYDPVVERDFGQQDVEALQLLAHQVAIAIENARLNQLKNEFLSIVSHELKTPITSIKGFAQVLQRRLSPDSMERVSRYLEVINHQADRLTGLINDLLDLSRIQTGRFAFEKEPVEYIALIEDVASEMRLVTLKNPIKVTVPERARVLGNADRIRQVLINLIDNAVKHGPHEGVITITVEEHGDEVTTWVCDEGTGLPPGEEERIFRLYYQVRTHAIQQPKGLGLGLFISRQIVDEHGGRIWLDGDDHTSFAFTLPQVGGTTASDPQPGAEDRHAAIHEQRR